ncbi:22159_t:CDS:2, partial [Cetraspora pellucida]
EEFKTNESINLHVNSVISTTSSHSSINSQQSNEDIIIVFEFLVPEIKLPKCKLLGSKVLIKSLQLLQENIIKTAQSDTDEQLLIILSFALHPEFKLTKFNSIVANLSWIHNEQWLKYYYEAWFNYKLVSILGKLIKYKHETDPYNMESFKHFKRNLIDFWKSTEGQNKVLAMSQIWSNILWSRKIKNTKKYDNQVHRLHVATPISSSKDVKQELVITNLDYQVSDNSDIEKDKTTRQTNQSLEEDKYLVAKKEQRNATIF